MPATRAYVVHDEEMFQSYVENTKQLVESELSNLVSRMGDLRLHGRIEYALLSHGKRLRPLMVILGAQSVGGNREDVISLALAIELLHTATLVHDDILDQDKFRRDIPAVHEKWSVNDAILVGDAMISLAINLTADYGRQILKITSETGLKLCDGERTVEDIAGHLAKEYNAPIVEIQTDVIEMLQDLADKGVVKA